jgi:hypothetical protein
MGSAELRMGVREREGYKRGIGLPQTLSRNQSWVVVRANEEKTTRKVPARAKAGAGS